MIAAVDVQYTEDGARAACVSFSSWTDARSLQTVSLYAPVDPAPYEPGEFYRRELPYLIDVLARIEHAHDLVTVVVDGYVWLGPQRPGLGARLHEALGGRIAVVGVAKTSFHGAPALEVLRGESKKPLYVTAVGMEPQLAAAGVRSMHGEHRIPTLLKQVDRIARGLESAAPG